MSYAPGAFKYGIDSDSGMVRTEILDDGSRRPFAVKLKDKGARVMRNLGEVAPWVAKNKKAALVDAITVDEEASQTHGRLTCSICGKTEKTEAARHRLLHRKTFEAPSARV